MRQHSDRLVDVLSGSFERELTVNVFDGADRTLEGLRFESWQLESGLDKAIVSGGSGTVVYESSDGESVVPVGTEGVLSPFRARVELVLTVSAGGFSESVSLGIFRVMEVPAAEDSVVEFEGRTMVTGSRVSLTFASLDADVDRWGFPSPEQSKVGVSAFGEIRRFTTMPVETGTVADVNMPSTKVWEAKQGGRLDAVRELGRILGGTAVVNSRGAWQIVPADVGPPVATLRVGEQGTVISVVDSIKTDTVYNEVIGSFEDAKGMPFYSKAQVQSGPLSITGPYGRNTRYYAADTVKTADQGRKAVQSVLAQSIGSRQYDVTVQCHVNPLVEVGDVVELVGAKRPLVGQLHSVSVSDSHLMNVTLRVTQELT